MRFLASSMRFLIKKFKKRIFDVQQARLPGQDHIQDNHVRAAIGNGGCANRDIEIVLHTSCA
jgi:hypothetical protein